MHEKDELLEIIEGGEKEEGAPTVEQLEAFVVRLFASTGEKVLEARKRVNKLEADFKDAKDTHNRLLNRCFALAALLPRGQHDHLVSALESKCRGIDRGKTAGG